jgi:hypothetical protein
MVAARAGDYSIAAGMDVALATCGLLLISAASFVLQRLYTGDAGPAPGPARQPLVQTVATARGVSFLERATAKMRGSFASEWILPAAAIAQKEGRYLVREPQYKAIAVNMLYSLFVLAVPFLWGTGGQSAGPSLHLSALHNIMPFLATGVLMLATMPLVFNIFGGEGAAVTVLLSFPTPRPAILLGKNATHSLLILALAGVALVALCSALHALDVAALAFVWVLAATPVMLGAGNLISVFFPHRFAIRGQRWSRGERVNIGGASSGGGTGSGCAYYFLYLMAYIATSAAVAPALAAVLLPVLGIISTGWLYLTVPLAALYSLTIYTLTLFMSATFLQKREQEIIAKVAPDAE